MSPCCHGNLCFGQVIEREVVQKDCQAHNLNRGDAMNRSRWKKLIKIGWWSGWWVGECFFWYWLTRIVLDKGPQNDCCNLKRVTKYDLYIKFLQIFAHNVTLPVQTFTKVPPHSAVKMSMMFAKYFEYYTIILSGWPFFSWTHCICVCLVGLPFSRCRVLFVESRQFFISHVYLAPTLGDPIGTVYQSLSKSLHYRGRCWHAWCCLWPPCVADADMVSFFLFFLAQSHRPQIGCLPYFDTWCGLSANLGCRSETCCMQLAENAGRKISPSAHHRTSLSGYFLATKAYNYRQSEKIVKQQYLLQISAQYGELWPTIGWDRSGSLGHNS